MSHDIKSKAIKATFFVVMGFGMSQVIRLGGNIVLTRLLKPEIFGLIAIANVYFGGIGLFTDIGFGPAIVRSKRAYEPEFLNTAWTVQVLRGMFITVITLFIAYPVSRFYGEASLFPVLAVLGISATLLGFQSTSIVILGIELKQGKLNLLELVSQTISIAIMIVVAYYFRSVWSLVIGSIVASIVEAVASHMINPLERNKFHFEREAFDELFSFGKWIILTTAVMFLATQSDKLLLGKIFPIAFFGVYNLAVGYAEIPKQIIEKISESIFYPVIAKFSNIPRKELQDKIIAQRKFVALIGFGVAILACFGDFLILFLYDDRYQQASWILPLLAIGIWPLVLHSTTNRCLYALGKPKFAAVSNISKFIYMLVFIPLSYKLFGVVGAVIVVTLNDIPVYAIMNYGLLREKLNFMKQDLILTLILAFFIILFIALRLLLGWGLPGEMSFNML